MGSSRSLIKMAPIMDRFYPDRIKKVFIVNAPAGFSFVWNLVKPFVPKKTEEKIGIYSTTGWTQEMLKVIPSHQIPPWLDERKTASERDQARKAITIHGGLVPDGQARVVRSLSSVDKGVNHVVAAREFSIAKY